MIRRKLDSLGDELEQVTEGLSPKVRRLIEVLGIYCPRGFPPTMTLEERIAACENTADLQLCGIVFVQRRTTCEVSFSSARPYVYFSAAVVFIDGLHVSHSPCVPTDSQDPPANVREANRRAEFRESRPRVRTQRSGLYLQKRGEVVGEWTWHVRDILPSV